ncbi:hypothetical protein Hamer_G018699 [Homarus americanus]|uniref:Uncharacterized protein n=1 Tax=Homarus americanus TaxID=6706 RepID=A0A8J5N4P8_HOMAM|nr:hypothetical protein Hamer_G018699 [Homarus americanus]
MHSFSTCFRLAMKLQMGTPVRHRASPRVIQATAHTYLKPTLGAAGALSTTPTILQMMPQPTAPLMSSQSIPHRLNNLVIQTYEKGNLQVSIPSDVMTRMLRCCSHQLLVCPFVSLPSTFTIG